MKDWRDLLVGDRGDGARGPRPRPDRGPQVDARHRPARAHAAARRSSTRASRPRAVAAYEDLLRELTRARSSTRRCPWASSTSSRTIAKQLPIQVLCRILGVPAGGRRAADRLGRPDDRQHRPRLGRRASGQPREREATGCYPFRSPAAMEVFELRPRHRRERRERAPRRPRHQARRRWEDEDGERLTEREFDTMFLLLVVAGNETTRQSIAHGMQALMEHPESMAAAARRPVADAARRSRRSCAGRRPCSTSAAPRPPTPSCAACRIREGDKVVVWLISGNYDERAFPDPLRFDIDAQAEQPRHLRARRARTSAWARTWPSWRRGSCSRSSCRGWRRSS